MLASRVGWTLVGLTAPVRMHPTFLVIGVKRGGTTSIASYLAAHPSVLPPRSGKGTHYFDVNHERGARWFRAQLPTSFAAARVRRSTGQAITGETSPYYVFHPHALDRIARELPDARLILLVRDPVLRAWSQHRHETSLGYETLPALDAFAREAERTRTELARMVAEPGYESFAVRHHAYLARGHYAEQVAAVWERFEREQVLVLQSERLFDDPQATMAAVWRHLGLPEHAAERYPVLKPSPRDLAMPDDVRSFLVDHYDEPNRALFELLGTRFDWTSRDTPS